MGTTYSHSMASFENIQQLLLSTNSSSPPSLFSSPPLFSSTPSTHSHPILIHTMRLPYSHCCIATTLSPESEETYVNHMLNSSLFTTPIFIYGLNCNDTSVINKAEQLKELGFTKVTIYLGGMFEWLMLQDIYGKEHFPTTCREPDLLKYKPRAVPPSIK